MTAASEAGQDEITSAFKRNQIVNPVLKFFAIDRRTLTLTGKSDRLAPRF
jgi:hypothetical protein